MTERTKNPDGLRNLGPKSWQMLALAGIVTPGQLRALGAVPAFVAVKRAGGKPSLNLLWAIEGGLAGRDWRDIAGAERTSLLIRLEDYERERES